jgi:hypothetical protein
MTERDDVLAEILKDAFISDEERQKQIEEERQALGSFILGTMPAAQAEPKAKADAEKGDK